MELHRVTLCSHITRVRDVVAAVRLSTVIRNFIKLRYDVCMVDFHTKLKFIQKYSETTQTQLASILDVPFLALTSWILKKIPPERETYLK